MLKGRFSSNLAFNLANFAGATLIGLWFTPYLIRHLGIVGYGLVPLASTFASYLGLLTIAIDVPVGRYLTIAIARNEHEEANRIFNSGLWAMIGILAAALIPLSVLCWKGLWWLDVPAGLRGQFTFLALCVVIMFGTGAVGSVFGVSAYAENRLDLSSSINLLSNIVRVGAVAALFCLIRPAVWIVGIGMVLSGVASLGLFMVAWRKLTPQLAVSLRWFSRATLREMAGFGGWTIINQLGTILFLSIDLLVVNSLLGPETSGRYATAMTFSGLLRSIGGVVAAVFGPTILMLYSQGHRQGLVQYSRQAVRFVGLFMALPIGLICGFSRALLGTWLGHEFEPLAPLMVLLTAHLCLNLAILPLFNIQVATGNVRWPGLVTCMVGVANLGLALLLAGPCKWGFYGVAAAGAITLTAKNLVFTPLYCAHLLGLRWHSFLKETLPIAAATLVLAATAAGTASWLHLFGWKDLILAGAVVALVWAGFAYSCLLSRTERAKLKEMIISKLGSPGGTVAAHSVDEVCTRK